MEYIRTIFFFLCLSLVTVVVLCDDEPEAEADKQQNCRRCKSGYYAILKCNDNHDTICAACPEGSYTSDLNLHEKCTTCSTCGDGYFVMTSCSRYADTVCESCLSVKDPALPSYRKQCLEAAAADQSFILPEPDHGDTLVLPDMEGSADGGDGIDLGAEFQAVLDSTDDMLNVTHIIKIDENEGSGEEVELNIGEEEEPNVEMDSTTVITTKKDEKSEEIDRNITHQFQTTTTKNDKLPDDGGSDDFSPVTTTTSTTTAESTKPYFVRITGTPDITTVGSIRIGEGIVVQPETEVELTSTNGIDPNDKNYVLYTAAPRNKHNRVHHHHVDDFLDKPVPTAEQKVGAQSSPNTEDDSKVTVGVVVAIAITAAFVFFILGFIVSVRCRRSRETFKVMKKVDKNGSWNSNSAVPIAIEYRDEERDGIYDDIDKDTTHNPGERSVKQERITPKQVEDLYAVPDKKRKSKDPEPQNDNIDRIRFIDETTDDEFGTKDEEILGLLRKSREGLIHEHNESIPRLDDSDSGADVGPSDTPPVEVNHHQGETMMQDPNVIIEEDEDEEDSESSPMLTNNSQENNMPEKDECDSNED
ncbi:uncharacterized protein LOC117335786 [Pecten maximus]|uniref:uncharacterized protein LOC117335786 n=1 Tax=Pecten maximus TaxID=6579 RepID=UPI00145876E8|nr:uncharacterized protein LOC117335786 [Pecten maximus]